MAINCISRNKGGGNATLVGTSEQQSELQSINTIVASIKDDIKNIKDQFDNLPPAPKGMLNANLFVTYLYSIRLKTTKSIGTVSEQCHRY